MAIRPAVEADSAQIFDLARDFSSSFHVEAPSFQAAFSRLIVQEETLLLVAEEEGLAVGYLLGFDHYTLFAKGRVGWVEEVMVRDDRRRQGIARL